MKKLKLTLSIFWRRAKTWLGGMKVNHPKVVLGSAVFLAMLCCYTIAKLTEEKPKVIQVVKEGEFKGKPIMGNVQSSVSEARETSYAKTANDILTGQKAMNDDLKKMNARISDMEQKVSSTGKAADDTPHTAATDGTIAPNMADIQGSAVHVEEPREIYTAQTVEKTTPRYSGAASTPSFGFTPRMASRGPEIISFPVASDSAKEELGVVLPVGSYVKAKIIVGTDATAGEPDPVLLQLDYSSILPNQRKLDLSGCFMTAKAQADLSTERVKMKTLKLSCVSKQGLAFEREVNGFVADDKDNKFAISGPVNSKQGRVAATAFLASVVEGVGKAVQMAQTTQQTTLAGNQSIVTGDEHKYMAGGAAANAGGMVAQWYLRQAENLLPSITVGSGRDVWIAILDNVNLPESYFKKEEEKDARFSYLTRILD